MAAAEHAKDRMLEKLDLMVRFWELTARHQAGGAPLSADEQVELLSWMKLITTDLDVPPPGPLPRTGSALPAQVIGAGTSCAVELRGVLARALLVTSASPLPTGASVLLRATDAVAGVEYIVPCVVKWVHYASPCTAALAVDGAPIRKTFGARTDPKITPPWSRAAAVLPAN
ncbi:MAG TPA: hypothetical protein VGH28_12465 [Polyangiaceae bacterium]|jgi:hypothetical protein